MKRIETVEFFTRKFAYELQNATTQEEARFAHFALVIACGFKLGEARGEEKPSHEVDVYNGGVPDKLKIAKTDWVSHRRVAWGLLKESVSCDSTKPERTEVDFLSRIDNGELYFDLDALTSSVAA